MMKMTVITVKIPDDVLVFLHDLVDKEIFMSRSEAIRYYLRIGMLNTESGE